MIIVRALFGDLLIDLGFLRHLNPLLDIFFFFLFIDPDEVVLLNFLIFNNLDFKPLINLQ